MADAGLTSGEAARRLAQYGPNEPVAIRRFSALQQLLYDLEAGMPFLFIDQLMVQAPVVGVQESRTRVLLSVSGLWGGSK